MWLILNGTIIKSSCVQEHANPIQQLTFENKPANQSSSYVTSHIF